ncbi:MAG: BamA/TamA family outer membrane protein [Phycisphaerales bacterium]|nr:BamA/TamA family outer membrane protein [Phycisphaerales bacterium]
MKRELRSLRTKPLLVMAGSLVALGGPAVLAQTSPASQPAAPAASTPAASTPSASSENRLSDDLRALSGRTIEAVRIMGNRTVPTPVILNAIRTREGDRFDPQTVQEDYQRVYSLQKFSNVEAKVEPTATGVIVVFIVTEQNQITQIAFRGNVSISTEDLQNTIDLKLGQAIDLFRINLARQAIDRLYREKNFPYAHAEVSQEDLTRAGEVIFTIIEGPKTTVRKVGFVGNHSFTTDKLKDQVKTQAWFWILRPGTLDMEQVDEDVASLRQFYQGKGFFDVRIGRKIIVSPDQSEVEVDYVIEEGQRYVVQHVSFKGNNTLTESVLRKDLKLVEGQPFDNELLQRDIRQIVRAYSPYGFIYQPHAENPDYLRIGRREYPYGAKVVFQQEPGKVELVYEIFEGKPFHLGRILVKGNSKTQDKVVLREMRVAPGQLYNSGEIQDATDRLRATPYFTGVTTTPIGDDAESRDLLVEVTEARTASFTVGAGVNSNGGVGGNLTFEQRNFDIANWPYSWNDIWSDRTWTGAGQQFRASIEPGTEQTNASILWSEPWLFDQPYSFTTEGYLRQRQREHWDENRMGGRVTIGKRFNYTYTGLITLRGEDVKIKGIEQPPIRAREIVALNGHSTFTSAAFQLRRDTTVGGMLPYGGSTSVIGIEQYGALGGEFSFPKLTGGIDSYFTLYEDLLDRKTILGLHFDTGWIPTNDAPFFERFYGGGIGSVRGFQYRGISPRGGRAEDPVGGNFMLAGSVELSFPLAGDMLRGVVFTDAGTVEKDVRISTIRSSIGAGIRLVVPFLGNAPIALDFAYPITKDDQDEVQYISFSFGVTQ